MQVKAPTVTPKVITRAPRSIRSSTPTMTVRDDQGNIPRPTTNHMRAPDAPNDLHNYHFDTKLGSGAFSTVWKVENLETHEIFACKIVAKTNLSDKSDEMRFQREIDSMAFLRHDNIAQLHDFFSDAENFYLILDNCPNGELLDFMVKNGAMNEATAALLFQQVASAIAFCHSNGIAHRDLKPQNILIQKFPFVKVSDFGLCGYIRENQLMSTFCGSPCYCAPECLSKIPYDGQKSDIWSLGVILYSMVTGEHPWNITNQAVMLRQILAADFNVPKTVSADCKDLITKMMQKNPSDRITMKQVLQHPWLKVATNAKVLQRTGLQLRPPALPTLKKEMTLEQMITQAGRDNLKPDHGIYSPFDSQNLIPEKTALPNLCNGVFAKCNSSQNLHSSIPLMPNARRGPSPAPSAQRKSLSLSQSLKAPITKAGSQKLV